MRNKLTTSYRHCFTFTKHVFTLRFVRISSTIIFSFFFSSPLLSLSFFLSLSLSVSLTHTAVVSLDKPSPSSPLEFEGHLTPSSCLRLLMKFLKSHFMVIVQSKFAVKLTFENIYIIIESVAAFFGLSPMREFSFLSSLSWPPWPSACRMVRFTLL